MVTGGVIFPFTIGTVWSIIISFLRGKYGIFFFPCGINSFSRLFSSVPDLLEFQIYIFRFPVASDIVNFPHLRSSLIPRVVDVEIVSVCHSLITNIDVLHH